MTTYYVDSAATGTADGLSEANAWTTIDTAMNNVADGDKVWVKASGTYDENGNIDTAGTLAGGGIEFEGYTSSTGDGGKVTWTNSSGSALTDTPSASYYPFKNFKFNSCSSIGVSVSTGFQFINCEFNSNGGDGINCQGNTAFVNCEANSNSGDGISGGSTGYTRIVGCITHSNTIDGISLIGVACLVYKSVIYGNGASRAIKIIADNSTVIGCTIDGENTTNVLCDFNVEYVLGFIDNI